LLSGPRRQKERPKYQFPTSRDHRAGCRRGHFITATTSSTGLGTQGEADLIVAKQRNGPTGRIVVAFLDKYTKFANMEFRERD
jgi:replicative DNA helicase